MIKIGDKSNAWNEYVHRLSGEATTHFFVDGDVFLSKDALGVLHRGLAGTPDANASTGVPGNGRNSGNWSALITRDHGIAGNLYALRGTFVDRIRKANIRLPTGLIGDDSWVGAYVLFDLDVARFLIHALLCFIAS